MLLWQPAHGGFLRGSSSCSRTVEGRSFGALTSKAGTLAGGAGGGLSQNSVTMNLPRMIGEVRVDTDVSDRMRPWPNSPKRFGSVSSTRRKREPYTLWIP